MSAEKLRQAANYLRLRVGKLTIDTDCWDEAFRSGGVYGDHSTYERLFVHPGIGLALADWLDACAEFKEQRPGYVHDGEDYADRVADLILGDAS